MNNEEIILLFFSSKAPLVFFSPSEKSNMIGCGAAKQIVRTRKGHFHRFRACFGFQPAEYRISKRPNSLCYVPGLQLHDFVRTDEKQLPWDRFYIILEYRKWQNLVEMMLFQRHNCHSSASQRPIHVKWKPRRVDLYIQLIVGSKILAPISFSETLNSP